MDIIDLSNFIFEFKQNETGHTHSFTQETCWGLVHLLVLSLFQISSFIDAFMVFQCPLSVCALRFTVMELAKKLMTVPLKCSQIKYVFSLGHRYPHVSYNIKSWDVACYSRKNMGFPGM